MGIKLRVKHLPEWKENNFPIESLNLKMRSSNSGRNDKDNRNKQD